MTLTSEQKDTIFGRLLWWWNPLQYITGLTFQRIANFVDSSHRGTTLTIYDAAQHYGLQFCQTTKFGMGLYFFPGAKCAKTFGGYHYHKI